MKKYCNTKGDSMLNGKSILITGGTGSFGKECTRIILKKYKPEKLVIFSRDEYKQHEMAKMFPLEKFDCLRFFLGDISMLFVSS